LAAAFMQAGTSSVVATLWKIPDQSTMALVEAFYRGLDGQSPGSALARAQREMLRRPGTSHPYNWAAFVLLGGSS
jgi:CHAT domain-containing protein